MSIMRFSTYILIGVGILVSTSVVLSKQIAKEKKQETAEIIKQDFVLLDVPFIWEVPDGIWVNPWSNACEESSLAMIEQYYLGNRTKNINASDTKRLLLPLFAWEDAAFGSNKDTDAQRTARMINTFSSMDARVQWEPTIEDIKNQLRNGNPVISLHFGYDLKNPKHRFRRGGSSYHTMVLVGFDEKKKEFIVNDPELKDGRQIRYRYAVIMDSLHNFDHQTGKANGKPVVLFTRPKQLVKTAADPTVYLIRGNTRHRIANMEVLKKQRISLQFLSIVKPGWLFSLPEGAPIE